MSQLAGRKLPQTGIPHQNWTFAAVEPIDHIPGNGGLSTVAYGPKTTSWIDDTNPLLMYFGECASGSLPTEAKWCICRGTITSPGVSKYEWAYVPAAGSEPAKYAGFDHIWNNRAALNYI